MVLKDKLWHKPNRARLTNLMHSRQMSCTEDFLRLELLHSFHPIYNDTFSNENKERKTQLIKGLKSKINPIDILLQLDSDSNHS